jgi:hypothetical protein
MSDYLERVFSSHIFGSGTFSKPATIAVALCSTVPNDASTGATIPELANSGSYARYTLNPSATNWLDPVATNGICTNLVALSYTKATADWGWISGVAICDSASYGAGNVLIWGTLTTPKLIGNGDTFSFGSGDISVTFA